VSASRPSRPPPAILHEGAVTRFAVRRRVVDYAAARGVPANSLLSRPSRNLGRDP